VAADAEGYQRAGVANHGRTHGSGELISVLICERKIRGELAGL
jgi:hypothetical protein